MHECVVDTYLLQRAHGERVFCMSQNFTSQRMEVTASLANQSVNG